MTTRTIERAGQVLDRAARMRAFRAPLMDRRLFDPQMRTPGYVKAPFAMNAVRNEMLSYRGIQQIPINKIRSEQPTVSLKEAKAKLGTINAPNAKPPGVIAHNGMFYLADGNHRTTAARALGHKTIAANVAEFKGQIQGPAIAGASAHRASTAAMNVAAPLLVGVNAAAAYQSRINDGGSTPEALGDAAIAGGSTAASGVVIGAAMRGATQMGFTSAAGMAARALPILSVAGHAAGYGYAAWQRGESGTGIAKAAGWGAVNGILPIDATIGAFGGFNAANARHTQAGRATSDNAQTNGNRLRGTQNAANLKAIIANRQSRAASGY